MQAPANGGNHNYNLYRTSAYILELLNASDSPIFMTMINAVDHMVEEQLGLVERMGAPVKINTQFLNLSSA